MKVGIVGAGGISEKMAATLNAVDNVEAYGIAARDLGRAKTFAQAHNVKKAYGSYTEMFKDPQVDLVYIATPHSLHYEQAKEALCCGKHVLCEKTFTVNAAQAEDLVRISHEKKLLLAEGMWTRYLPSRKIMTDIIESGQIGKPSCILANIAGGISHMDRVINPVLAGGAIMDMGAYIINSALMLFGSDIKEMQSHMIPYNLNGIEGMDAVDCLVFTYWDGRMAILHVSVDALGPRQCTIEGSKGYITWDTVYNPQDIKVYNLKREIIAAPEIPKQITGFEYEVESCRKAVEKGEVECPEMPHDEILRVMRIMDYLRKPWGVKYPGEN